MGFSTEDHGDIPILTRPGNLTNSSLLNMAQSKFEIVSFPMKNAWWIFPVSYVNVYQRVPPFQDASIISNYSHVLHHE